MNVEHESTPERIRIIHVTEKCAKCGETIKGTQYSDKYHKGWLCEECQEEE